MSKKLMAVYGTLRKGGSNHNSFLRNAEFVGEFKTKPEYTLHKVGGYPGLKKGGKTEVVMEVYNVTSNEEQRIDWLEGYDPNSDDNNFFNKKPIETPFGEASVYFYEPDINNPIESGDFIKEVGARY